jgi:replicative DNA helicase
MSLANTHIDVTAEWRTLAKLCDPNFTSHVDSATDALFTNERKRIFSAIKQSFDLYGSVSPESIEMFYGETSPAELDVMVGTDITVLLDRLHNVATRRQLVEKAKQLEALANGQALDFDAVHKTLEFTPLLQEEDTTLTPGTTKFLADLHRKMEGTYKFTSTGFQSFDIALGGEWATGLTLIGALPGSGKTTLAFQSALDTALADGTASGFFSMEMGKDRLIARGVSHLADIALNKIKIGDLTQEERERVEYWTNRINDLPIHMVARGGMNVTNIIGYMREFMNKGVKVFYIDHLQCIASDIDNRNAALGHITRTLKTFADKYGLKVILLCHLVKKDGRLEVRDSGEPQGIAETFMTLTAESKDEKVRIEVGFEKNRDGDTRSFPMIFDKPKQRFIDGLAQIRPMNISIAAD